MTTSNSDPAKSASTQVDEVALIEGAANGDAGAFDALFRYLAPFSWNFASGVTGDAEASADAVVEGFATALTAVRAGRIETASGFRHALLRATRNRLSDTVTGDGHTGSDDALAIGFGTLPEKLRSALWLSAVSRWESGAIGDVIGNRDADTSHLINRGRQALMSGVIRAASGENPSPLCEPSIDRLRRDTARKLTVAERALLRRHLRLCSSCQTMRVTALRAVDRLGSLALPFPEALIDAARPAFVAVVSPGVRGTGLSPKTEKVVAALSASVAALGMAGASMWGTAAATSQPSVAIGPVVGLVGGPQPPIELPSLINGEPEATGSAHSNNGVDLGSFAGGGSESTSDRSGNGAAPTASNGLSGAITAPDLGTPQTTTPTPAPPPTPTPTPAPPTTTPPSTQPGPDPEGTNDPVLKAGVDGVVNIEVGEDPAIDLGKDAAGTGIETGGFLDVLDPVIKPVNKTLQSLLDG